MQFTNLLGVLFWQKLMSLCFLVFVCFFTCNCISLIFGWLPVLITLVFERSALLWLWVPWNKDCASMWWSFHVMAHGKHSISNELLISACQFHVDTVCILDEEWIYFDSKLDAKIAERNPMDDGAFRIWRWNDRIFWIKLLDEPYRWLSESSECTVCESVAPYFSDSVPLFERLRLMHDMCFLLVRAWISRQPALQTLSGVHCLHNYLVNFKHFV